LKGYCEVFRGNAQFKERERKKKKNSINAKLSSITIHAPLKEAGTVDTNKKITKEDLFGHLKLPCMSLEYSRAVNTLVLATYFFLLFFYIDYNIKLPLGLPHNNKNQCKSIKNLIESCFKNFKSKDNMVISLCFKS